MTHNPGFLKLVNESRARVHECMIDDVKAKLDRHQRFHLIDVREDHEFSKDHIKSAHHLGKGILERDLEKQFPDPDTEIIMYCGGGFRSALTCDAAQKMGYRKVSSLIGGYKGLVAAGWPMKKEG